MKNQRKPSRRRLSSHARPRSPPRPRRPSTSWCAFCQTCEAPFWLFEKELLVRIAVLGCCLIRLFLTARHERLDVQPFLDDGKYRPGDDYAERTLKTVYGEVTYGRQYLMARGGGSGFFPLDVVLGLTRDRLSPWVMQWVARLATRMSFKAAQMVVQGGAELGAGDRDDRASGAGHGTRRRRRSCSNCRRRPRRRRGAGDRGRWQMSADGDGGGVGQAAWQASAAAREELPVRLPTASRPGQTAGARQQETPEKRGQKQERQGSGRGRDVHA